MRRIGAATLLVWLALDKGAAASCPPAPSLEQHLAEARTAFVGTVVETSSRRRIATVVVERIWLGSRLPRRVVVQGGPRSASETTSVDRAYSAGERYLFVLSDPAPPFREDDCSGTTEYTGEVAALEPEGAITPRPSDGGRGPWLLVGLALVSLGVWQSRRALRRARSMSLGMSDRLTP